MPIRRKPALVISPRPRMQPRKSANFKKVDLKRAIHGAQMVGLEIGEVAIKPDGTISIKTAGAVVSDANELFDKWQDRL